MNYFLLGVFNAALAIGLWEGFRWLGDRFNNRYRFKCDRCDFKIKTNNKESWDLLQKMIMNHEYSHDAAKKDL